MLHRGAGAVYVAGPAVCQLECMACRSNKELHRFNRPQWPLRERQRRLLSGCSGAAKTITWPLHTAHVHLQNYYMFITLSITCAITCFYIEHYMCNCMSLLSSYIMRRGEAASITFPCGAGSFLCRLRSPANASQGAETCASQGFGPGPAAPSRILGPLHGP